MRKNKKISITAILLALIVSSVLGAMVAHAANSEIITTCTVDGVTMTYKTSSWKKLYPEFKNMVSANMLMCNVQANDYEMTFTVGKDKTATDYEMICGISPDMNINKMKIKKYKSQQDVIKGLGQIITTYIQSDDDHELLCVVRGEGGSGKMSFVKKAGGLLKKEQVKAEVNYPGFKTRA